MRPMIIFNCSKLNRDDLRGIFSNRHPNVGNREKMKVDLGII